MQIMEKRETKKDFITAFWKLYENKPIEKISIQELCELAGYNRTTFYNYYANIYDLLENAVEDLTSLARDKLENLDDIKKLLDGNGIQQLFLFILKMNNHYIELLMKQQHHYILEEKIKAFVIPAINQKLKPESPNKKYMDYIIAYQLSAAFGIIKHWFASDKNIEDWEMVQLGYKLASQGPLTLIYDELWQEISTNTGGQHCKNTKY